MVKIFWTPEAVDTLNKKSTIFSIIGEEMQCINLLHV